MQGGAASSTFLSSALQHPLPRAGGQDPPDLSCFLQQEFFLIVFCCGFEHSSCLLLVREIVLGRGALRDPAWPRAEGRCLAALITGRALDRASPWPVCSSLSSARKFLLLCTPSLLPSEEPQFQGTGAIRAGALLCQCGWELGAGAAPHPSNLSERRAAGGCWHVSPVSHRFWGDKLTVLCLSLLHGSAGSVLSWDFLHVFLTEAIK